MGTRRRRPFVGVAVGLALTAALVGCSSEQRRSLGEQDLRDSLSSNVHRAADAQSLILGSAHCTATIDPESSAVRASCAADATTGTKLVGTYVGAADVGAETCLADLIIEIDGVATVKQSGVNCFDAG